MSPLPLFTELGKQARDLFEKNFYLDCVKVQVKNALNSCLSYEGSQAYSMQDGNIVGKLKCIYNCNDVSFAPEVTTDSSLISAKVQVKRAELRGVNLTATGNYNPQDNKRSFEIGGSYNTPKYNVEFATMQSTLTEENAIQIRASGVTKVFGCLFGASLLADPKGRKIVKSNLGGAFEDCCCSFLLNCEPQEKKVTGSAFKMINEHVQAGLVGSLKGNPLNNKDREMSLSICANYNINSGATLKARINSNFLLGVAYSFKLKDGISITMCSELDASNMNKQGGNKVGFGIEFVN